MSLNAFDIEVANGLNEQFWSAWGPELQKPSGVGHLGCRMEQDQGQGKITAGLCDNKKAKPTGMGQWCLLSRAICDHPELCETPPHASC